MSEAIPTPTDSVELDLGDGKIRHLRYSLGSMRRLKKKFGKTLIAPDTLMAMDEDTIPELIFEGLVDREGIATSDELADLIDTRRLKELLEVFFAAFAGSKPEKNAPSQTATP
jgi:hypothetical protein